MYKKIPGNGEYEITIHGEIRKVDGSECELNIIDKKVLINIYGNEVCVDLEWLGLMAHFEVFLPKDLQHEFFNINNEH